MRHLLSRRASLALLYDLLVSASAVPLALVLRVGDEISRYSFHTVAGYSALLTGCAAVSFLYFQTSSVLWRFTSVSDAVRFLGATTIAVAAFTQVLFIATRANELPRSVPILVWIVLTGLVVGPRLLFRAYKDARRRATARPQGRESIPVLLFGNEASLESFLRRLQAQSTSPYYPVGLLTPSRKRTGHRIRGVEILGEASDVVNAVEHLDRRGRRPRRLIVTNHDVGAASLRELLSATETIGLGISRVPDPDALREGIADAFEPRPISLEDLLGRPQAALDRQGLHELVHSRKIVVTGAGGSIGSELVRQLASFGPSELVLAENSEFNLYTIESTVREAYPGLQIRAVIADVRDRERLAQLFTLVRPHVVFHAAALKHVPIVEANPFEGLLTNAIGTRNVADACRRENVEMMVLISTDKAVNPGNVMGASKRIAEIYCQALDVLGHENGRTRFATVRFGNVLGSTGSVVPLFRQQLEAGGPLTVTHPEVTRYFMTIREAAELVLQAAVLARKGGEPGRIFVLEMGEPIKIVDLAKQMIRLAGLRLGQDVQIAFTGLRPGEKLYEEIFHAREEMLPTEHSQILIATPRIVDESLVRATLEALESACRHYDLGAVLRQVASLVPEYQAPSEEQLANVAGLPFGGTETGDKPTLLRASRVRIEAPAAR
jgi:FlaA1/EpsC-like NDP-sugar epimerase